MYEWTIFNFVQLFSLFLISKIKCIIYPTYKVSQAHMYHMYFWSTFSRFVHYQLPCSILHSLEKTFSSSTETERLYFENLSSGKKAVSVQNKKKGARVPITVRSYRLMLSGTHVWQILFGYQVPNWASHFLCKSQPQQCFSAPVPSLHAYRAAFQHQTHKSNGVQKRGGQVGPELPLFSHTAELFILSSVILSQPTHTILSSVRGTGDSHSLCLFSTVMDW